MWQSIVGFCENQIMPRMGEIATVFSCIFVVLLLAVLLLGFFLFVAFWVYFKVRYFIEDNKPENMIASLKLAKVERELKEVRKELSEWEKYPHLKMKKLKERRSIK